MMRRLQICPCPCPMQSNSYVGIETNMVCMIGSGIDGWCVSKSVVPGQHASSRFGETAGWLCLMRRLWSETGVGRKVGNWVTAGVRGRYVQYSTGEKRWKECGLESELVEEKRHIKKEVDFREVS